VTQASTQTSKDLATEAVAKISKALALQPRTRSEIQELTGLSQTVVQYRLTKMAEQGVVSSKYVLNQQQVLTALYSLTHKTLE